MSDDDFSGKDEEKIRESTAVNGVQDKAHDGGRDAGDIGRQKLERIFEVLTSQRRRYILYEIQDSEVSDIDSLANTVIAMEKEISPDEVDHGDVEDVRVQLMHSDIPKLADAGFIEYDPRSEAVRYSDPPTLLDTFLRLCANVDRPSERSK